MIARCCWPTKLNKASGPVLTYKNAGFDTATFLWRDARRSVPRPWMRSAEFRGERRYENGNTIKTTLTFSILKGQHFTERERERERERARESNQISRGSSD